MHGDRLKLHRDRSGPLAGDAGQSEKTGGAMVSTDGDCIRPHSGRGFGATSGEPELLEQQVSDCYCHSQFDYLDYSVSTVGNCSETQHDKSLIITDIRLTKRRVADEDEIPEMNTAEARRYCRTPVWMSSPSVVI